MGQKCRISYINVNHLVRFYNEGWIRMERSGVVVSSLFICRDTIYEICPVLSDGMTSVVRHSPYSCRLDKYLFKSIRIWFCGRTRVGIKLIEIFIKSTVVINFFVILTKLTDAVNFQLNIGLLLLFF